MVSTDIPPISWCNWSAVKPPLAPRASTVRAHAAALGNFSTSTWLYGGWSRNVSSPTGSTTSASRLLVASTSPVLFLKRIMNDWRLGPLVASAASAMSMKSVSGKTHQPVSGAWPRYRSYQPISGAAVAGGPTLTVPGGANARTDQPRGSWSGSTPGAGTKTSRSTYVFWSSP